MPPLFFPSPAGAGSGSCRRGLRHGRWSGRRRRRLLRLRLGRLGLRRRPPPARLGLRCGVSSRLRGRLGGRDVGRRVARRRRRPRPPSRPSNGRGRRAFRAGRFARAPPPPRRRPRRPPPEAPPPRSWRPRPAPRPRAWPSRGSGAGARASWPAAPPPLALRRRLGGGVVLRLLRRPPRPARLGALLQLEPLAHLALHLRELVGVLRLGLELDRGRLRVEQRRVRAGSAGTVDADAVLLADVADRATDDHRRSPRSSSRPRRWCCTCAARRS